MPVEDDILLRWNHCQNARSKITGEVAVQLVMKPGTHWCISTHICSLSSR